MPFPFVTPRARSLVECFDHLSEDALFDGACQIERRAYDFPHWESFTLGRLVMLLGRSREECRLLETPSAALRGYTLEQIEFASAVDAWRQCSARGA